MQEIINKIFNRKSCHQIDHETIVRSAERLCNAQRMFDDREEYMQRTIREALSLIGMFDPKKMMEFYESHKEIEIKLTKICQ